MSLLLLLETPFQIVQGIAAGSNASQTGIAIGAFAPAAEVVVLTLPIQTTISLVLPIGLTPPPITSPLLA